VGEVWKEGWRVAAGTASNPYNGKRVVSFSILIDYWRLIITDQRHHCYMFVNLLRAP